MKRGAHAAILLTAMLLLCTIACKTDPVIPAGGIPTEPPVKDPGEGDLCAQGVISFQHEVLPLLISSCAYSGCHDAISREEGVVLDTYEHVMREVRPGKAGQTPLYEYLLESGDDIMPPPPAPPFTTEQVSLIRDWIEQGAQNTGCGTNCDSGQTSFSANIFPLIRNYCVGCHNSGRKDGGVNLENYQQLLPYAQSGALLGCISHDPYYAVMPPSGSILSDCRIAQIAHWIDEGALDN